MDNFFIVPMNPVSFQNDLDLSKNEKILGGQRHRYVQGYIPEHDIRRGGS